MEQVHIERLRTLYSMMAGLPPELIYMPLWRSESKRNIRNPAAVEDETLIENAVVHLMNDNHHRCGTAACALGWAAAYPEFKEAGLRTNSDGWPVFEREDGSEAGAKFFGISVGEAMVLFGSDYSDRQKEVFLARLRNLLLRKRIITKKRNDELFNLEFIQAEKDKIATYVFVEA